MRLITIVEAVFLLIHNSNPCDVLTVAAVLAKSIISQVKLQGGLLTAGCPLVLCMGNASPLNADSVTPPGLLKPTHALRRNRCRYVMPLVCTNQVHEIP
jgi:hypothetical protein